MAAYFNHTDINQLNEVFHHFDPQKTGFISPKQLGTTLRSLEPRPLSTDIDDMIRTATKTDGGRINFNSYMDMVSEVIEIRNRREQSSKKRTSCHENLTEGQINELKDSFQMFDQDGDGTISIEEMKTVMHNLGQEVSEAEVKGMMKDVDTTNSGTIDFSEFMTLMTRKMSSNDMNNEILEAFQFFDKDNDGSISGDELRQIMMNFGEDLSHEEIDEMIKEADTDGDGEVDYDEFVKMMTFFK